MKKYNKIGAFEFSLTGFFIGLIVMSMFVTGMAVFLAGMNEEYAVEGTNTLLNKYNITAEIIDDIEDIENSSNIGQEESWLDVIGGFFTTGYKAVKTSLKSYELFESFIDNAESESALSFIERFQISTFIKAIVIIILIIGIAVTVIVKMRI